MSITQPLPARLDLSGLARVIADWQARWTEQAHANAPLALAASLLARTVQEQHQRNYALWHTEDRARAPRATDAEVANVKRQIDKLNQERNDLIERLDEAIVTMLVQRKVAAPEDAPWNTETPGGAIDRLSILALRVYHMHEQGERKDANEAHRERCQAKHQALEKQRTDLVTALQELFDDLFAGRKQMKLYRQFKMYNDATLNPEIYKSAAK